MATRTALENAWKNPNARAFLDMISAAEGTTRYGYHTLVGGTKLQSLDKHPNIVVSLPRKNKAPIRSTAAGRYQFLFRTWSDVARALSLPDFGPHSQDIAALELIARRGGLNKVLAGDLKGAIAAVRKEWASFPGAGYGQGERTLAYMQSQFNKALAQHISTTPLPPTTATNKPPTTGSGSGGTALGMVTLPPALVLDNPGAVFGGMGTVLLVGGAALAIYYLFFAE